MKITVTSRAFPMKVVAEKRQPWWLHDRASKLLGKALLWTRLGSEGIVVWGHKTDDALTEEDLWVLNADDHPTAWVSTPNEVRGIVERRAS